VQAGMSGFTTPDLFAGVSNAGGLGILGVSRMTTTQLQQAINSIKEKTDQPFGVNLLLAPPEQQQGNNDVATTQNFLNHFRQNLQIPLPPSPSPSSPATNIPDIKLPHSTSKSNYRQFLMNMFPCLALEWGILAKFRDKHTMLAPK
jgi:NAD(P)H-dependent flavin oxidoreductase YrpB (nitropropane dioxygenase family)